VSRTDPVVCQRCGHDYAAHRPACAGAPAAGSCGCTAFRWIDPAPAAAVLSYRSDPQR